MGNTLHQEGFYPGSHFFGSAGIPSYAPQPKALIYSPKKDREGEDDKE